MDYAKTARTTLKRAHQRGLYDRASVHAIIDEALIAHVAVPTPDGVMNIPTSHWRIGDRLYIHGAAKGRSIKAMEGGAEVCIAISLLDGVVFARSAYAHSVNFRSVMIYAKGEVVGADEKETVLKAFLDKYAPGRWDSVRPPSAQEMKATKIIAFDLKDVSGKSRSGPPSADDLDWDVWAGVVPLSLSPQTPVPCEKGATGQPEPNDMLPHLPKAGA